MQLRVYCQISDVESSFAEVCNRHRRAQRNWAGRHQIDDAPQAHVLVRGTRIPVDPVNAKIFLCGSACLDREHVCFAGVDKICYIEIVSSIGAGDSCRVRDFMTIEPDFASIVDSSKVQPGSTI